MVHEFHRRGLRERVLTLPVMVALVLTMVWQQMEGVTALVRLVQQELILWVPPLRISAQALEQRLRCLPADLFRRVLEHVLPRLHATWPHRQRPLPTAIAWAQSRFNGLWVWDASTLDVLQRRVGVLRDAEQAPLAGRITALLRLDSRLPWRVWYEADPKAHEQNHWSLLLAALPAGALVVFDLGYTNFERFGQLTAAQVTWITRAKNNLVFTLDRVIAQSATVRDRLIRIGASEGQQTVRLIEMYFEGKWYRYLTNALDPTRLPAVYAVMLYRQRWRIEDAFLLIKRLLGLSYFWCGAQNAVELQIWATWLLYAVLIDLTDAVAEALRRPFADISVEMVFRSLPFATGPCQRGEAPSVVAYLATHAKLLGLIKRPRAKPKPHKMLDQTEDILSWA